MRIAGHGPAQRIKILQQLAAAALALLGDALCDDAFHGKDRCVRVATGGKRHVALPKETGL